MPSHQLILCHTLLHLPSIFPSIRVFCNDLNLCIRWPKYWSFNFSFSPPSEYPGFTPLRVRVLSHFSHVCLCSSIDCNLPGSSPSPRVCSNSCPLSQWYYLTISSSAAPFSFCLQSFPASGSFPVSWLFTSGGQSGHLQLQHQSFQWIFRVDFL